MTPAGRQRDDLYALFDDLCDGLISEQDAAGLDELLQTDAAARWEYLCYLDVHAGLGLVRAGNQQQATRDEGQTGERQQRGLEYQQREVERQQRGLGTSVPSDPSSLIPHPSFFLSHSSPTIHSFIEGVLFSYLIAALIMGAGMLIAWTWKMPEQPPIARQYLPSPSGRGAGGEGSEIAGSPLPSVVGRITGMVDCRWEPGTGDEGRGAGDKHPTSDIRHPTSPVALGDKIALRSGLLEITYDTGARVLLQGPCTYEVESNDGGYLSLGKLTARVETRSSQAPRPKAQDPNLKSEIRNPKSEISNPQSPIPNPSPAPRLPPPVPLFTVRTPTAIVTDLGTEFGVEVSKEGLTTSHVFRGSVRLQAVSADGKANGIVQVLRENQSARAESSHGGVGVALRRVDGNPGVFVRRIVRPVKTLDLLDIVAGGNGLGRHRERGIDPTYGMEDPVFMPEFRPDNREFHRATTYPLIDGTFVPNGAGGPVVLDSAGHTFDGFPRTPGRAYGSIWSRAVAVKQDGRASDPHYWVYYTGPNKQYMPEGRGLLGLHANVGITFNLAAIRTKYASRRPTLLRATAGPADARGKYQADKRLVDLWIFVDGQPMLKRTQIRPQDGAIPVRVEIGPNDRFLTIAVTDGGNGVDDLDWFFVGDPVLELTSVEEGPTRNP